MHSRLERCCELSPLRCLSAVLPALPAGTRRREGNEPILFAIGFPSSLPADAQDLAAALVLQHNPNGTDLLEHFWLGQVLGVPGGIGRAG